MASGDKFWRWAGKLLGLIFALALGILVHLPLSLADDDHEDDHEQAFEAVTSGDAEKLSVILEKVSKAAPGKVLGVDVERHGGGLIYEIKVLAESGIYYEVEVDARSTDILKIEEQ